MKAKTQRLWIFIASLGSLALATGLILYGLQENITFFYSPSDLKERPPQENQVIRLGGMVQTGSVKAEGTNLSFAVTDFQETVQVHFTGIPPDLFREGQGVVAEGYLTSPTTFFAKKLLAKHDENYMPPQIKKGPST